VKKLTFAGGEPTLCPFLPSLLRYARELGFVVSIVTNGERLLRVLKQAPCCVDWVALSVDSANDATNQALGRGKGGHAPRAIEIAKELHATGVRVKLNTVVTSLNWQERMADFVCAVQPERWKIFQVLPVAGQNHARIADLLITADQFRSFVDRHRPLERDGVTIVPETNENMTASYAMIDPAGRFFSNAGGRHAYSKKIIEVGVFEAFQQVQFSHERFTGRGGHYEWDRVDIQISAQPR